MNKSHAEHFKGLHFQSSPLRLTNVWDAPSTILQTKLCATAIATSSASLAWANGFADGDAIPTEVLKRAVATICKVTHLPVSIDIEKGYSDNPKDVSKLVLELLSLGVVGINIEDGTDSLDLLADKIKAIKERIGDSVFINARTDVYLRQLVTGDAAQDEVITRAEKYIDAGADGIFVPAQNSAPVTTALVEQITGEWGKPVNLMVADVANTREEEALGVKRLSCGPFSFLKAYQSLVGGNDTLEVTFDLMNASF
ncbi:MAG: isocitrate lyase/phosphoenolpyruvate mutase family protein [Pseudomonadota bacterium]